MSTNDFTPASDQSNTWFEGYFEDRLAQIDHDLQVWAIKVYFLEDRGTHDAIMQKVRIALWRRFSENPEEWAVKPRRDWLAYAKETFRWGVTSFHRDGIKWLGLVDSDMDCMAAGRDITDDEALSMLWTSHSDGGQFAYPRDIQLADLRMDLEAAIARGMRRLCATQRRDMPRLIADLLEGYTLDETCARYGWTRNRGVTLMRKLRTVFYEELSGQKKNGYLGSHHPLTEAEKQRIRELYATGLSYRKVGALVGRSPSAVESVCKRYPPELVAQVRDLRQQGLSFAEIAQRVGRGKSYIGWLAAAELSEGSDKPHNRDGDDLAPVSVAV
jgi:transposase